MKNAIDIAFKNANKENRPALISYTVCGDNNKKKIFRNFKIYFKKFRYCRMGYAP